MNYLTAEQALFIHARLIAETGGAHGVLNLGLLQSAVARPQAIFDGQELYPDLYAKAAALLESLVNNHAFIDGDKHTAITAVGLFLLINDIRLVADNQALETFVLQCAQQQISLADSAAWLANYSIEV
jgi:death on curing protein